MLIFGLHSTFKDWLNDLSDKHQLKCKKNKKGPPCHQKIKCSFLDYVQLLMIDRAIWVTNVDWNTKKNETRPLCHQKIKWNGKKGKRLYMSLKNKMFIFGLCSTSDDQPSDLSNKHRPKCKKMKKAPPCHQEIKCSFFDYIQLLMIDRAIWATNVNQNTKKWKKARYVIEK